MSCFVIIMLLDVRFPKMSFVTFSYFIMRHKGRKLRVKISWKMRSYLITLGNVT